MKIIQLEESQKDVLQLEELKKQRQEYEKAVSIITDKIRAIIYKYDTAKIDYTKNPKR